MGEPARRRFGRWKTIGVLAAGTALLLVLALRPGREPTPELLVTFLPAGEASDAAAGGLPGRAVAAVEIGGGGRSRVIAGGFAAVGTAQASYDGRRAVFAARRQAGDPSRIWETALDGSAPRAITGGSDCLDPAWLPDGRIVYARALPGKEGETLALHVSSPDGGGESRLTFGRALDRAPAVLPDGRLIFRRRAPGGSGRGALFCLNTDGTGLQLFSEPPPDASVEAGPWPVGEQVLFAEKIPEAAGGGERLVSVSIRQPFAGREVLSTSGCSGATFAAVAPLPGDALAASLLASRKGWSLRRIYPCWPSRAPEFPAAAASLFEVLDSLRPSGMSLGGPRSRPLRLTSVVDPAKASGTLLCLDVRASRLARVAGAGPGAAGAVRVLAGGVLLGEAPVEEDGSFFVEVPADLPLEIEILDRQGLVASDRSGFWVRPNENRACLGCHEHPELSPENRVPLALSRPDPKPSVLRVSPSSASPEARRVGDRAGSGAALALPAQMSPLPGREGGRP